MKLTTRITLVFLISVLAIIVSAWVSHTNTAKINETRNWVEHTQVVLARLDRLFLLLKEAETSMRGIVVTRAARMDSAYQQSKSESHAVFEELKTLTADNPRQVQRLAEFYDLYEARYGEWDQFIASKEAIGSSQWQALLNRSFESKYAAKLKNLVEEMKADEQNLLKVRTQAALQSVETSQQVTFLGTALMVALLGAISAVVVLSINRAINALVEGTRKNRRGTLRTQNQPQEQRRIGFVSGFVRCHVAVEAFDIEQNDKTWIKKHINNFGLILQGQRDFHKAAEIILNELAPLVEARQAVLYRTDTESAIETLSKIGSFACDGDSRIPEKIKFGDGVVGQCAVDKNKVHLEGVSADSFKIKSALAESNAADVYVLPIQFEGELKVYLN